MIVYIAANKINGKQYVGQTTQTLNQRKRAHKSDALGDDTTTIYFHRAIRKYGWENFDWDILVECNTIEELNRLEIYYIRYYDTYNEGYNLTIGGNNGTLGYRHTEKSKRKMSKSRKGKALPFSEARKAHLDKIRPLTKSWHASKEGRLWHTNHAKTIVWEPKIENRCRECGNAYLAKTASSKYCHNNCKAVYNRRSRKEKFGVSDRTRYKRMVHAG